MGSWLWLSAEAREAKISCVCYSCHEPLWMAWLRVSRASEGRLLQGSKTPGVSALSLCFRSKAQPGLSAASPEPGNLPSSHLLPGKAKPRGSPGSTQRPQGACPLSCQLHTLIVLGLGWAHSPMLKGSDVKRYR